MTPETQILWAARVSAILSIALDLTGIENLHAIAVVVYLVALAGAPLAAMLTTPTIGPVGEPTPRWEMLPILAVAISIACTALCSQLLVWSNLFNSVGLTALVLGATELIRAGIQPATGVAEQAS